MPRARLAAAVLLAVLASACDRGRAPPAQDAATPAQPAAAPVALADVVETTPNYIVGISYPKSAAKYPELARSVRRQGTVLVEAEIATDGSLRSARVVSTPLGFGLEQSALDAVRAWRFAPARYGERPVAVYYRWNILFTLR